ncbi:MAG: Lrp/AsnC ligand binding domain-containing protein [Caldilineaceae bacterium]|mgnify:CR=1 FL=1|nr:Lrp/AsnC ligand binding domain-containing protein [Caldilineaceae bacterium]
MVSAVVLLRIERNLINAVAEQLAGIEGISEVFSVAGQYDLVAILRVRNNQALADLVTSKMLQVDGILDSETLIAFKVYSRHDLESMFEIGFEEEA